jgi:hypothetical protein
LVLKSILKVKYASLDCCGSPLDVLKGLDLDLDLDLV